MLNQGLTVKQIAHGIHPPRTKNKGPDHKGPKHKGSSHRNPNWGYKRGYNRGHNTGYDEEPNCGNSTFTEVKS
jgi:hypothetical protein